MMGDRGRTGGMQRGGFIPFLAQAVQTESHGWSSLNAVRSRGEMSRMRGRCGLELVSTTWGAGRLG